MAKKILFINQEIGGFSQGELADMGKLVPTKVVQEGFEVRVFSPKWGNINERRGQLHEVIRLSGMNIIIKETDHPLVIKVASMPAAKSQAYFIDNDDYFLKRLQDVDAQGKPYDDNGERAVFYARGVLETVKKLRWIPDVIHCQGWMSYIVPFFLRTAYADEPSFASSKIVTSLFPTNLEGFVCDDFRDCLVYRDIVADCLADYPEKISYNDLAKIAVDYSDGVIMAAADVDAGIVAHAEQSGKPLLHYPGEDFAEAYAKFYADTLE
ncbi:MAG: glycogen/starch synthase [Prevotella sp.]